VGGGAGSVGFGLGTDTSWSLDYMHQSNDRTPDYGVPMAARTATGAGVREPITELGVPRSNYYGKDTDRDRSDVDMLTSRFSTEVNDWLTIKNDTRLVRYDRYISVTSAICGSSDAACNAVGQALYTGIGDPTLAYGAGGGPTYDQTTWGIQNVTTGIAEFETGNFRHQAVFGLDMAYQQDERQGYSYSGGKGPLPTLWNPNTSSSSYSIVENPANVKDSDSRNVALFASDRVWLTDEFSLIGGVRWDYYKAKYDQISSSGRTITDAETSFVSPKISAIWEPTKDQSYYLSYAVSKNVPWGQYIASDVNGVAAAKATWDPETSSTVEAGAKLDFLDGRLGVTGAVFQVTKDNSIHVNPDSSVTYSGEKQRVRGVEVGVNGKLTDQWDVYASYTYLDSQILDASAAATIGNPVAGVAKNSGSIWTTYDLAPHFDAIDGELLVGGG
jgi:Outer membrane receptor for monomeric catechols